MKRIALLIIFLMARTAFCQVKAYKDMGDKAFADKDFYTAAYYYDKALQDKSSSSEGTAVPYFSSRLSKAEHDKAVGQINYRLAESYRSYHNYLQAESWYKQVADKYGDAFPDARLWYGVCLRANNHYDEALKQIQTFISDNKGSADMRKRANKELDNTLFAKQQLTAAPLIKAVKMGPNFNADAGDFGLSIYGSQFWFTSSRTVGGKHVNQIYVRNKDNSSYVTRVDIPLPEKRPDMQYSASSVAPSGKAMYLTIWYKEDTKTTIGIYISRYVNNQWTVPQKLNNNVNVNGYKAMQPFVTADGKTLYYASDKPGGLGGTDIWKSDLDEKGMPLNSTNLGSAINTANDEEAPYYGVNDHKLVYSSNGMVGMGGFDLFESFNTDNTWSKPRNLGYPFNSSKDDLYYYPDDKDENLVYLSSDRETECCLSLFKVYYYTPLLNGLVIDCASNKPLRDAKVSLIDSISKQTVDSIYTNRTAKYSFKLSVKHAYVLRLEKEGYFTKNIQVPAINTNKSDTLYNPTVCQQSFQVNKPIIINNIFYDFNKASLRIESQKVLNDLVLIMLDNPTIKVELSSHTDSFGSDTYNLGLSQERAQACVDYIVSKGVDPARIVAKGYGKTRPIQPNQFPDGRDNPNGRQMNRRTEFKVLSL